MWTLESILLEFDKLFKIRIVSRKISFKSIGAEIRLVVGVSEKPLIDDVKVGSSNEIQLPEKVLCHFTELDQLIGLDSEISNNKIACNFEINRFRSTPKVRVTSPRTAPERASE